MAKQKLKLYLISQNVNCGYDTYDSYVVVAKDKKQAKRIHPDNMQYDEEKKEFKNETTIRAWTNDLGKIKVELLGIAKGNSKIGVVCSSYNAG